MLMLYLGAGWWGETISCVFLSLQHHVDLLKFPTGLRGKHPRNVFWCPARYLTLYSPQRKMARTTIYLTHLLSYTHHLDLYLILQDGGATWPTYYLPHNTFLFCTFCLAGWWETSPAPSVCYPTGIVCINLFLCGGEKGTDFLAFLTIPRRHNLFLPKILSPL